ncbi:DUF1287 domain-containing protein [Cytobacillus firmus]|uniref:DUF1287 domain-containing protein n=1 Tax=Cytobacillus firmus TaxID=1399 RepID=UPI0018CFDCEE|nr:DUF1287 domain-containing protein [Cytobacillus firmus]MBG9546280.1 hypothetical protein [Cytobacillus firmus]MBG9600762.1 hypothetical protein [Cytobacillus firmus]MBG9654664.1 hypothetical protein [Cytobacillus firmus]MED1905514.1 DUF1287 domain-containing protein [Cytobacillus firmus]MED1938644.1 DUF1287 domain-containing protein [Cytobacillus firmus]
MIKKVLASIIGVLLLFILFFRSGIILDSIGIHIENPLAKKMAVPSDYSQADSNQNGIADPLDMVLTARKEVDQRTPYKSAYYAGGYPPDGEGVCTDVIWRGFQGADVTIKDLIDQDIAENTDLYSRVEGEPDPNIDFRRVPNQNVFFSRFAKALTTELIPGDVKNLQQWQPGDIVVFLSPKFDHIAIISDKRTKDGIPYVIHNSTPFAAEVKLSSFKTPITAHYRWDFEKTPALP